MEIQIQALKPVDPRNLNGAWHGEIKIGKEALGIRILPTTELTGERGVESIILHAHTDTGPLDRLPEGLKLLARKRILEALKEGMPPTAGARPQATEL